MKKLILELDEDTFQRLKKKFKGDEKAMQQFIIKTLIKELKKSSTSKNSKDTTLTERNLKGYVDSGKSGSRSYGIKGQGW